MSEREEFQRLLQQARANDDDATLRAWWEARYNPASYSLLQCALSCATMESIEQWTRLTVPDGGAERYVGRFNKERGLLEVQYRGNKKLYDLNEL